MIRSPAAVGVMLRVVLSRMRSPRTRSRAATDRETAAWDVPRSMAASVNVWASTTATSARRYRNSIFIRPSYRTTIRRIFQSSVLPGDFGLMEVSSVQGGGEARSHSGAVREKTSVVRGVLTMTGSAVSNQIGAGIGAHAFPTIGPAGVVAVRQLVAAVVLLSVARPPFRRFTWRQWWPVLLLGTATALMNICLYM